MRATRAKVHNVLHGGSAALALALMLGTPTAHAQTPTALELQASAELAASAADDAEADAAAEVDAEADAAQADTHVETRQAQRARIHSTFLGSSGGLHVADAGTGAPGSLRLQLGFDFFAGQDYLRYGDTHRSGGGTLSLSYTALEFLEVFAALAAHSDFNDFGRDPLLQALGDFTLGVKAAFTLLPGLSAGGEVRLFVPSGVGEVGVGFEGTSVGLRGNLSADLRQTKLRAPLITRFTLGYYFDQSANLIDDVESARYAALSNPLPLVDEDRHLVTRQERLAFAINRVDRVDLQLGLEVPLHVVDELYVHPLLEWRFGVPVNRQDYDCLNVSTEADDSSPDGCLDQQGVAAMPMTLSVGARVYPWLPGFAVTLGVDVGLTGARTFVRELAPNRPWAFLLAFGYAHDPAAHAPRPATPAPEPQTELAPWRARIDGVTIDSVSEMPVAGVRVEYLHREPTAQVSDDEGRFLSYAFESGEVRMALSHPDYEAAECLALLDVATLQPAAEPRLAVRCPLVARPKLGALEGRVKSASGEGLAGAAIRLTGPQSAELVSDGSGSFSVGELPPGSYELEASAAGYQPLKRTLLVPGNQTLTPELVLAPVPPPTTNSVRVTKNAVVIKRAVHFRHNSAELETDSFTLLDEVAAVLAQNPELTRIQVQGHTDNRGQAGVNRTLSQQRAETVLEYLVRAGVAAARLSAKGYGDSRPLVPNLTDKNRARNRRVEFIILERAK